MIEFLETIVAQLGSGATLALAGLAVGMLFGIMAQRSRFCLRAAIVEFVTRQFGEKLAIWLLAFGVAIVLIQLMLAHGDLDAASIRALAARGSLSGAMIGGLLFGCGMILSRGCASRLLVLSATGNLRSLIAGLVFVVVTQSAYQGALEPLRIALAGLWTVDGGTARDLVLRLGGSEADKVPLAVLWLVAALVFAVRGRIPLWGWIGGAGCGLAVALAYWLTQTIGTIAMEPGNAKGITFSGPSAEFLMRFLVDTARPIGFDTALVPGVFLGAALAALFSGEWKLTVFDTQSGTLRYMIGASLMGFGAMLAGGCAVGAGVSGGAMFALTAWAALLSMWVGAGLAHWLIDARSLAVPKAIKSGRLAAR